ncbi:LysR family transcriptional regulator [Streptomyces sp. NPDC058001]|uniref:LysR family transcriptional regulator n=1 Tax=Streptomyces sp. NPDC058001 TaxID=3346300 RepID=UPI0036E27F84
MNLESVRAFVAVAEEGQFRHAAGRLGVSQQAVSKRIAALESALGVPLFTRLPTGAALTADGRTFLPHARAVLVAVRQAVESVQSETRPLRVHVLGNGLAPAALMKDFHRENPGVPLEIMMLAGVDAAVRALLDGEIDAGYVYLREPVRDIDPRLDGTLAYLENFEIITGDRHPLADAKSVTLTELSAYTAWVPGIVEGSEWGDFYRELAEDFGLAIDSTGPDFGMESLLDSISASRSLVTFYGDLTSVAWLGQHRSLKRVPLTAPTPAYPWSLIWHANNHHPGLRELIRHTHEHAPPPPGTTLWLPRPARPKAP